MTRKELFDNLNRVYDDNKNISQEYLDSLPDIQNIPHLGEPINLVGIHNFKLPLKIQEKSGGAQDVMASITGSVGLEAEKRGINMSRIIRSFYKFKDETFTIVKLTEILKSYLVDLDSYEAHISINFQYRIWQDALRSLNDVGEKEGGWQYYNVTFDCNLDQESSRNVMWMDYVYSSSCPCSTELSQHTIEVNNQFAIPHSQRSIARIGLEFYESDLDESNEFERMVWLEDMVDMCNRALTTETLVFCKRVDEQAFAEKNGAQPKFVEDAVRLLGNEFNKCEDIIDYKIICSHQESLHSHDAIAVLTKGLVDSKFDYYVSPDEFRYLSVR